jgi:Fur family zinc uptake transcriptional regulator
MADNQSNRILVKAAEKCAQNGSRLTSKRLLVLELLVKAHRPLSAYELVDRYNKCSEKPIPPMSAYRILDFLLGQHLVHKLASENKYIACSHIACDHAHQVSQFLICRACHKVKEVAIQQDIIARLSKSVNDAGYQLMSSQLELDCLCQACAVKGG